MLWMSAGVNGIMLPDPFGCVVWPEAYAAPAVKSQADLKLERHGDSDTGKAVENRASPSFRGTAELPAVGCPNCDAMASCVGGGGQGSVTYWPRNSRADSVSRR
jgi:hypothetical protein